MSDLPVPTDPKLGEADLAIMAGIRTGLRDEEIARSLGARTPWVAARIRFLCRTLELESRSALGGWDPSKPAVPVVPRTALPAPAPPSAVAQSEPAGRRISRRAVLTGSAAVTAGVAIAGATAWLRSGGGSSTTPAGRDGTATTVPTSEPSPTVPPTLTAALHGVADATREVEKVAFVPGARIEYPNGIFFMDTNSGAVDGLSIRAQEAGVAAATYYGSSSEDNAIALIDAPPVGRQWLIDRATGGAVGWKRNEHTIVGGPLGKFVLMEDTRGPDGEVHSGKFTAMAFVDGQNETIGQFSTTVAQTLIQGPAAVSADGKWVTAWVARNGPSYELLQFEVATGRETQLFAVKPPGTDLVFRDIRSAGNVVVASITRFKDSQGRILNIPSSFTAITHRPGSGVAEVSEPAWGLLGGFLSPDSRFVVRDRPLRRLESDLPGSPSELWPGVEVTDLEAGGSGFAVRSALLDLKPLRQARQAWLADSSAFVAFVKPDEPFPSSSDWEQVGLALIASDGSGIERLPQPASADAAWGVRGTAFGPEPSPTDSALLSYGGRHVFNRRSGDWLSANVAATSYLARPVWRSASSEMVFCLAGSSVGAGPAARPVLLPPLFERELPGTPDGLISATRTTLLRAEPAPSAAVVASATPGEPLSIAELPADALSDGRRAVAFEGGATWVRVRTEAGAEGWLKPDDLRWL